MTHCGSGPVPGRYTGPGPVARLLRRHPRLRLVVAHLGMPEYAEFLGLAERHASVLLDTTMAFTPFIEAGRRARSRRPSCPGCATSATACCSAATSPTSRTPTRTRWSALERTGLGAAWLRAVCHDNAARLFGR